MSKIVVVGSSNTDMIAQIERIPKPGETVIGGAFSMAAGGKGANQAVAAARAGASGGAGASGISGGGGDVSFIARVGEDMFGEQAVDGFVKDNIDVSCVARDTKAPSGVALIFVDQNGENSIAVASGANANLSPADIEAARDTIAAADVLVMQLETPLETVLAAAQVASENGVKVILNPAPAQPLPDELLQHVSVLTPNESETELLTGIKVETQQEVEVAAQALFDRGVDNVLITLGPRGVCVLNANGKELVAGFKVQAVDTTAAGDVFNGALAVALAEEKPLIEAVMFANAAAALSVTKRGAQRSAPTRAQIDALLDKHR